MQRTTAPLKSKLPSTPNRCGIFKGFPRLCPELRIIIWQQALHLSTPRVVGIEREWTDQRSTDFLVPTGPPSALLQVNKEARSEAFKVFAHTDVIATQLGLIYMLILTLTSSGSPTMAASPFFVWMARHFSTMEVFWSRALQNSMCAILH